MRKIIMWSLIMGCCITQVNATESFQQNARYDVGFSPRGGALDLVLNTIKTAQSTIIVAAYTFTSRPIASALVAAQRRGVKVWVIGDKKQNSNNYSGLNFLANNGVAVALNGRYLDFHNKFMVIDGQTVETGSFNYSSAASSRNSENAIVLWNVPNLAAQYTAEWKRLWQESDGMVVKQY